MQLFCLWLDKATPSHLSKVLLLLILEAFFPQLFKFDFFLIWKSRLAGTILGKVLQMVVQWPFLEVLSTLNAMFWCFSCDGGTQPSHGQFMTPELPPFPLLRAGEIMNLAFGMVLAVCLISLHLFLKSLTSCMTLSSFFWWQFNTVSSAYCISAVLLVPGCRWKY